MKKNHLLSLFAITIIAVVVAIVITHRQAPTVDQTRTILFPDLKTSINALNEIAIQRGQKTLTLVNEAGTWKIREADGHSALFSKIKQTAIVISDLELLAEKTRDPKLYPALGVEDPAADKAESSLLTLKDKAGKPLVTLIVGKNRLSRAAADKQGLYVRIPGQEQALLVAGQLDISVATADWLDKNLINIGPDRIRQIDIVHGNDQDVSLHRYQADAKLVPEKIPAGKQARSDYEIERLAGILEDVIIDDVKAAVKIEFPADAITTIIQSFDGLTTVITSTVIDEKNYAKFAFQYTAPAPPEPTVAPPAETKPVEALPAADQPELQPAAVTKPEDKTGAPAAKTGEPKRDVAREAADLTAKTTGWVYQIPVYKFDTFTRKLSDLVEEIPKEEPAEKEIKK